MNSEAKNRFKNAQNGFKKIFDQPITQLLNINHPSNKIFQKLALN